MTTQRDRGSSKRWPFTRPMPATSPSAGVRSISSSTGRRRRCAAMTSGPYSTKVPGSQRSSTFSRAVRWAVCRRRATASGRAASRVCACRCSTSARSGRTRARSTCAPASAAVPSTALSSSTTSGDPSYTVSPAATCTARTIPPTGAATTCSIFIASMTRSWAAAGTASPGETSIATTVPCMGARTTTASSHATGGTTDAVFPCTSTASGSCGSTLAPARPAVISTCRRGCGPSSTRSSCRCSSTKRVVTAKLASAGWRRRFRRNGRFVDTPSVRNSERARHVLATTPAKSVAVLRTTTLASSESKLVLGR